MKIGIVGAGRVGHALAVRFVGAGHEGLAPRSISPSQKAGAEGLC
jgi:predicted dinucleotide-binding enzyme